jgi:hypothetical protein
MATVLVNENIEFDLDTLDSYVRSTYPDLRKCLNNCQMNSGTGTLLAASSQDGSSADWKLSAIELFKAGKINDARKLMCSQARPEEMGEIYTWLYQNIELWSQEPAVQDQAIIIIRNGMCNIPICADPEVNLSATICELAQLR